MKLPQTKIEETETEIAKLRSKLGENKFIALWNEGQSMEIEKAIEFAIGL